MKEYFKKLKKLASNEDSLNEMEANEILSIIKNALDESSNESELSYDKSDELMSYASDIMQSENINRYMKYMIHKSIENEELDANEKQNLYFIIYILQAIFNYSGYYTGLSDSDFDKLNEFLHKNGEEIITTPILNGKVRHHRYKTLRGTLSKVYGLTEEDSLVNKSRRTLDQWLDEKERYLEQTTGIHYDLKDTEIYVFPKWDGVSLIFEFDENNNLEYALTRGNTDTNEAQDVSSIFTLIQSRIKDNKMTGKAYGLKTEVMTTTDKLKKYNATHGTDFKNTRSIISSIVNSDEIDDIRLDLLEVIRLRTSTLDENGNETLQELAENAFERPYLVCRMSDRQAIKKFAYDHSFVNGLRCDGAVIYIKDENLRRLLGRKDNKNQYEVAFKFNEDIGYSRITSITFSVTPFGKLFPVANFHPLKLKGNTVQNVSLGSISRFNDLHLAVGDMVKILYEIIPYLVYDDNDPECMRSDNIPIQLPEFCPECGSIVEYNEKRTMAFCTNPECGCRKRGKLINYAARLGIQGFGEATVTDLYEAGILNKISDFYKLKDKHDEIVSLKNYGDDSFLNMVKAVEGKGTNVSLDKFIGAMGIESCGERVFRKILDQYTLDELLEFADDMKVSKLSSISGIGDKMGEKILTGLKDNKKEIVKLTSKYVNVYYNKKNEEDVKFIAVFHNIRSVDLTHEMEKLGGTVEKNLTKRTSLLIVPNGDGKVEDGPAKKAKKYGCPIVEFDNVLDYIKSELL